MSQVLPLDENIPSASTAVPAILTREYSLKVDKTNYCFVANTKGSIIEIPKSEELLFLPEGFDYVFEVQKNDFKLLNGNRKVIDPLDLLLQRAAKEKQLIKENFENAQSEIKYLSELSKELFLKFEQLHDNPAEYFKRQSLEGLRPDAAYILNGKPAGAKQLGRVLLPSEHKEDIAI